MKKMSKQFIAIAIMWGLVFGAFYMGSNGIIANADELPEYTITEGTNQISLTPVSGSEYITFKIIPDAAYEVTFSVDLDITTSIFGNAVKLTAGTPKKIASGQTYSCRVSKSNRSLTVMATKISESEVCSHSYSSSTGKCSKCGDVCKHPIWYYGVCETCKMKCNHNSFKKSGIYSSTISDNNHVISYDCAICGTKDVKEEEQTHTWKIDGIGVGGKHSESCTVCGVFRTVDCVQKSITTKHLTEFSEKGCYHEQSSVCECGGTFAPKKVAHSFKKNVCTVCKFKQIVPGKTTIKKVKQTQKLKKKKWTERGHWDSFGNWISTQKHVYYTCKVKLTLKKGKNTYGFNITTNKSGIKRTVTTKKTTYTLKYDSNKVKPKKITVYVTPISKTGTLGKTVRKVVKLK